ncbi:MAG TPA: hypothetical protein VHR66_16715 [Gemmataceae bacterium]|nr:hypothetical protein [Gemmataceae bacterium]
MVHLAGARLEISGKTTILTGSGDDQVRVAGPGPGRPGVLGNLSIDTAGGNDGVLISALHAGDLTLKVGPDTNTVAIGDRTLNGQPPTFLGPVTFAGRVLLTAENGNNNFAFRQVTFSSFFHFQGSQFVDELVPPSFNFMNIQATIFGGDARFDTGAGRDRIDIQRPDEVSEVGSTLFFGRAIFDLGRGDDVVNVGHRDDATRAVVFVGRVTCDGGPGTDAIRGFSPVGAIVFFRGHGETSATFDDAQETVRRFGPTR